MKPLCALVLAALASPALAAAHSEIVPKGSLYYQAATTPPDKIPALCAKIVARQNAGKVGMDDAAQLYFHGMLMGVHCVAVDYVKALTLSRAAGDAFTFNTFLRLLKDKAAAGNPAAAHAIAVAGTPPM